MDMEKIKDSCLVDIESEPNEHEPTLALAEEIIKRHPYQISEAVVFGEKSVGKTAYSIKVGVQVYQAFEEIDKTEAWDRAVAGMVFTKRDFKTLTEYLLHNRKILPLMIIDDAGMHMGSQLYHIDREAYQKIGGILDQARTSFDGVIITTPRPDKLAGCLRSTGTHKVEIFKADGHWGRTARSMKEKQAPDGVKQYYTTKGGIQDSFSCYMPKKKHEEYNELRRTKALEFLEDWGKES